MWHGSSTGAFEVFPGFAVRLHDRAEHIRRAFRLANDVTNAPCVSPLPQTPSQTLSSVGAQGALGVPRRINSNPRGDGIHVVGAWFSNHLAGGRALACSSLGRVLGLVDRKSTRLNSSHVA